MPLSNFSLTRRQALLGFASLTSGIAITNCGNSDSSQKLSLGARFADGFQAPTVLAAGSPQRAPYVLLGEDGWPAIQKTPRQIELNVKSTASDKIVFSGEVLKHGEPGVIPYYPLVFTPPSPGEYLIEGKDLIGEHRLVIADSKDLKIIQIGDYMPRLATPTIDNNLEINPICTKVDGPCPLHQLSLDKSLAESKPIALLVSSPRFCQTDVCGPALEVLIEKSISLKETVSIIHTEVFIEPNNNDFSLSPIVRSLGLTFEPSLIVSDKAGIVKAILHFAMDKKEVEEALSAANK